MKNYKINVKLKDYDTLFLDRDGTINVRKKGGYVSSPKEFEFLPGVLEALHFAVDRFTTIVIVTNQQGIGKQLMTMEEVNEVHQHMMAKVVEAKGRIDQIYVCPYLEVFNPLCRKPNPGMALQAQEDFPLIDFSSSIMVGDADSDILFGRQLGMYTVRVKEDHPKTEVMADLEVISLLEFIKMLF